MRSKINVARPPHHRVHAEHSARNEAVQHLENCDRGDDGTAPLGSEIIGNTTQPALGSANRSKRTMKTAPGIQSSDSEDGNRSTEDSEQKEVEPSAREKNFSTYDSDTEEKEPDGETGSDGSDDQGAVGSTAFGRAFAKIMKRKLPSSSVTETMGPVLSAHKRLITMKVDEAGMEQKTRGESKKSKQAFREKGHVIPAVYLGAKDRELIKLATKGVVKLFNAVSKAQSVQQEAISSKDSEVKEIAKQSKSTFLEALRGGNSSGLHTMTMDHVGGLTDSSKGDIIGQEPGWSALRSTFMLGKSRLKDWDTREDVEADACSTENSSDGSP